MGYLSLDSCDVDDFTQCVISFWFRVPQGSLDQATSDADANPDPLYPDLAASSTVISRELNDLPTMRGIIPLVMFGRPQKRSVYETENISSGTHTIQYLQYPGGDALDIGPWTPYKTLTLDNPAQSISESAALDLPPCYIGIECVPADLDNDIPESYTLKVHLQMDKDDEATKSGLFYYNSSTSQTAIHDYEITGFSAGGPHGPGFTNHGGYGTYVWTNDSHEIIDGERITPAPGTLYNGQFWPANANATQTFTFTDISGPTWTSPEIFELGGQYAKEDDNPSQLEVKPGEWCHVLLSFDLTHEVSAHGYTWLESSNPAFDQTVADRTDGAAQAWLAYNDVNIKGRYLSNLYPPGYDDENAILTVYAYTAAETLKEPNSRSYVASDGGWHQTQLAPDLDRAQYSYSTKGVPIGGGPMGFPGVSDFVDNIYDVDLAEFQMWVGQSVDTSDIGVRRLFVDDNGRPVPPKVAADALGPPAICIHRSGSWITGRNSGTSGVDDKGKLIAGGQFSPVGTIIKFRPDPVAGQVVTPDNPDSNG